MTDETTQTPSVEWTGEFDDLEEVDEDEVDYLLSLVAFLDDDDDEEKALETDEQRRAFFAGQADASGSSNRIVNRKQAKQAIKYVKYWRKVIKTGKHPRGHKADAAQAKREYKRSVKKLKSVISDYEADGAPGGQGALIAAGLGKTMTPITEFDGDALKAGRSHGQIGQRPFEMGLRAPAVPKVP